MGLDIVGYEDDESGYDDESGALDIIGYDVVGATRGKRRRRIPGLQNRQVIRTQPRGLERLVCPFPSLSLATTVSGTVTATPQRPMRIERVVMSGTGLIVTDIKVGAESQFVASGNAPIEAFGPTATDTFLKGATATPGMTIAVSLTNPTGATVVFYGVMFGPSLLT